MFKPICKKQVKQVTIHCGDEALQVDEGMTVAAAMLLAGKTQTRTTAIRHQDRGPFCLMGVCYECLMEIDGKPNQQACLVTVKDGMKVNVQQGAPDFLPDGETS